MCGRLVTQLTSRSDWVSEGVPDSMHWRKLPLKGKTLTVSCSCNTAGKPLLAIAASVISLPGHASWIRNTDFTASFSVEAFLLH